MDKVKVPDTLVSEKINERMEKDGLSIRDLAIKTDVTYEHIRSIVRGERVPARNLLKALCEVLKLNYKELEHLATADKIRQKYGMIPLELSGKNPELEPIERVWEHLSEEHKNDLIAMAKTYSTRDRS